MYTLCPVVLSGNSEDIPAAGAGIIFRHKRKTDGRLYGLTENRLRKYREVSLWLSAKYAARAFHLVLKSATLTDVQIVHGNQMSEK